MALKKNKRVTPNTTKNSKKDDPKKAINAALDELIQTATKESQLDSFYERKAAAISSGHENCFFYVSKRFIKAEQKEKEILLHFFKYWPSIEHIKFLQEFVAREIFWPRTGTLILDLFNKCDAMLEEGLATRLLELDSLAQRLKQHIANKDAWDEKTAESTIAELLKRNEREKRGILIQLTHETGIEIGPLLLKMLEKDQAFENWAFESIAACATEDSLKILEYIYQVTKKKDILKIIKKSIHLLKQKGIEVAAFESAERTDAIFKKISLPQPHAFISSIDGIGDRLVFMVKPISTFEYKFFQIYLSDVHGIKEILAFNVLRKESRAFIEKLFKEESFDIFETPPDHAGFLVEEAYRLNQETGNVVSGSISQWRNIFNEILNIRKRPVIYDFFDAEEIRNQRYRLLTVEEIFERKEILYWFFGSEEANDYWNKYKAALNSPLVLSPYQQEARLSDIHKETAGRFFNQKRKALFQRRLEETAYFFYKKGSKEKAGTALCAALSLCSQDQPAETNPFCLSLIKEGFKFIESGKEMNREQDQLIVNPKDISLLA